MTAPDLPTFLAQRFDEQEEHLPDLIADCEATVEFGPPDARSSVTLSAAYVLADLAAKRRIVERCSAVDYAMPSTHLAHGILAESAQPFADHPDFDARWAL